VKTASAEERSKPKREGAKSRGLRRMPEKKPIKGGEEALRKLAGREMIVDRDQC